MKLPKFGQTAPTLPARDVVGTLYRAILGRDVDPVGADYFADLIANGATSDDVATALKASPECKALNRIRGRHPLSSFADFYTDEDTSYFMHRGKFRPLAISIETINICNNDCVICPYSAQTRKRGTMSKSLFEKIVSDYAAIGGGPVSLTPLVGEAFLDKHLLERLSYLKRNPAITSVSVTTNGVMAHRFDDNYLRSLLSQIDRLKISVYGLDREEYAIMTKKDEYDLFRSQVIRIASLARAGSVVLGIRHLKAHTEDTLIQWRTAIEQASGATVEIASIANEFANWSHFDTSKPLPLNGKWRPVVQNATQCGIPLLGMQILSGGRVSFCACANFDGAPELVVGDLNNQSLSDILDLPEVAALWDWRGCGVPEFCKSCSFHIPLETLAKIDWLYRDPVRFIGG